MAQARLEQLEPKKAISLTSPKSPPPNSHATTDLLTHGVASYGALAHVPPTLIPTRHRANTSMYSLTFCVRVMLPERHHWKPAVEAAAVMLRTPPSPAGH